MTRPRLTPWRPMTAVLAAALPSGAGWSYEVKWDGYRVQAVVDRARVTLFSRNLRDVTRRYPGVAAAFAELGVQAAVVDGELVALDRQGRPCFQALGFGSAPLTVFYAFDLLHLNGRDLLRQPLDDRRRALTRLVAGSRILRSEPLPGTPGQIERAVRKLRLEGVVAKRRDSRYEPGVRSRAWVKVKFARRQEFIVGGYVPLGTAFDSLLAGYLDERGALRFAAKVRAGLTPRARRELMGRLERHPAARCPFIDLPTAGRGRWGEGITAEEMQGLRWVRPRTVIDVSFTEWTREGRLRHPAFVGVRTDKQPAEVRREGTRR